eukprot:CAMPEP_0202943056 /NCGR_PEP_ID=MMETSP1395-20130829/3342_1 /ASSEMBLY_ACC=CAM_ASM_000871 /TAXON_ID=5961 /ORGANISM="Blepharisma japonicum, Strain Stock R1072" /LENGTH=63 /DNA_ID=CAMNT_0049639999 /DNA_START=128 /DNA_END=319 /DNA_ORIENTATION=-
MTEKSNSGQAKFCEVFLLPNLKTKDYNDYDPTASTDTSSQEDHYKEFIVFTKDEIAATPLKAI